MHTTCYSDCLHSLLQANQYYREWHIKFGQQGGRQEDVMQRERRRWSIVSKSPRGMYRKFLFGLYLLCDFELFPYTCVSLLVLSL